MTAESNTAAAAGGQATADAQSLPHDSREYAEYLVSQDPLKHLRDEFLIPSKADLVLETLPKDGGECTRISVMSCALPFP